MKRTPFLLLIFCITVFGAWAQNDGGMICGKPNTAPEMILRIQAIDSETHFPITGALVNIKSDDTGLSTGTWQVNSQGVAVYIAGTASCIPTSGTIEVIARHYQYSTITINQYDLLQRDNDNRLFLPAFPIQWADLNQIPTTQQLVALIGSGQFTTGVHSVRGPGGILYPNEAPACYSWVVKMVRVDSQAH